MTKQSSTCQPWYGSDAGTSRVKPSVLPCQAPTTATSLTGSGGVADVVVRVGDLDSLHPHALLQRGDSTARPSIAASRPTAFPAREQRHLADAGRRLSGADDPVHIGAARQIERLSRPQRDVVVRVGRIELRVVVNAGLEVDDFGLGEVLDSSRAGRDSPPESPGALLSGTSVSGARANRNSGLR